MTIQAIDHYTLRVAPSDLARLRAFYCDALGLVDGDRPPFSFPGHWLYAAGRPVVHLAGNERTGNGAAGDRATRAASGTGRLDHISLRSTGLADARDRLARLGIAWHEASVPGAPLHQLFLHDPTGLKIELTFDADELVGAGPRDRSGAGE